MGGHGVPAHQKGALKAGAWIVFADESGLSLWPPTRATYAPRGHTPALAHQGNRRTASMAAALGYDPSDPGRGPRLCFDARPASYDTCALIAFLEELGAFYEYQPVVLLWDGLSAHWSKRMRAWAATQPWLTLEQLPAYAPQLNPVELLWSSMKKHELANLAGHHLSEVAQAAETAIHRITTQEHLPHSYLAHTGLQLHPQTP